MTWWTEEHKGKQALSLLPLLHLGLPNGESAVLGQESRVGILPSSSCRNLESSLTFFGLQFLHFRKWGWLLICPPQEVAWITRNIKNM